jgi:Domain of unknown function (DUF202)
LSDPLPDSPVEGRDPGVQPERTSLAWRRTLLALTVVVLLAVRLALRSGLSVGRFAAVIGLAFVWAVACVVARRRMLALQPARPAAPGGTVAVIGFCAFGFAAVSAGLALAEWR